MRVPVQVSSQVDAVGTAVVVHSGSVKQLLSFGDTAVSELLELGLSPRTVRLTHSVLKNALAQAVKWCMAAHKIRRTMLICPSR